MKFKIPIVLWASGAAPGWLEINRGWLHSVWCFQLNKVTETALQSNCKQPFHPKPQRQVEVGDGASLTWMLICSGIFHFSKWSRAICIPWCLSIACPWPTSDTSCSGPPIIHCNWGYAGRFSLLIRTSLVNVGPFFIFSSHEEQLLEPGEICQLGFRYLHQFWLM